MMEHAVYCEELFDLGATQRFDRGCWTLELADALSGGWAGQYAFYAMVDGVRVDLAVGTRDDGEPCLRPVGPAADAGRLALPWLGALKGVYARPVSPR